MSTVGVEREEHVWTVTIDRPEVRNAVDGPTARALADAFRAFDADEGAGVAILTGAGGHFCAGADLRTVARGTAPGERGDAPLHPPEGRQRPCGQDADVAAKHAEQLVGMSLPPARPRKWAG